MKTRSGAQQPADAQSDGSVVEPHVLPSGRPGAESLKYNRDSDDFKKKAPLRFKWRGQM
jgi:hypothetical protein